MSSPEVETRVVTTLSRAARTSVVGALLLVVAAVYLLLVPIEESTPTGAPFRCGTAAAPAAGAFAASICSGLVRRHQLQAGALAVSALIVIVGGIWAGGTTRRTQVRVQSEDDLFARRGVDADAE
jgi:hypothetical protein